MEASGSSRVATLAVKNLTGPPECDRQKVHPVFSSPSKCFSWASYLMDMWAGDVPWQSEAAAVKKTQIHPQCHFTEITIPSSLCRCIRLSDLFQPNKLVRKKIHWYPQTSSGPKKKRKRNNKTISWLKHRLVRFSTFQLIKQKKMKNVEDCKKKKKSEAKKHPAQTDRSIR